MLQGVNKYMLNPIVLLLLGTTYTWSNQLNDVSVIPNNSRNNGFVVLDGDKPFSEQLTQNSTVYAIRDDFDLRQNYSTIINISFNYKNHKYYRARTPISLQSGQGIWVPNDVFIFNKSLDTILSNNGFYISDIASTVYICYTKSTTIHYKLSGLVTMPEDCVLRFEGGTLSNGVLRSVRTKIQAAPIQIFGENMLFSWYWDVPEAYPEWFGAKGDKSIDDGIAIQKCLNSFNNARLTNHVYYSAKTLYMPSHGRLIGSGMYHTSIIYTKSVDNMICSDSESTLTGLIISRINLSGEDSSLSIKKGVSIASVTKSTIESVYVSGANVGFSLNSYFGSQIKGCIAHDCKIGFYLGSEGGNSTSVDYDNCYANKCVTGHLFRRCSYVTTKNTSADFCDTAYDFVESCVTMISPGAEDCKYFMTLIPHSEISKVGNYHSNSIHIINGQAISNKFNDKGVIYISTSTRGYDDRNRIVIDGFKIDFKDGLNNCKLLSKSGDAVLHLNNLISTIQPDIESVNYYRDGVAVLQNLSTVKYWTDKVVGTSVFIKSINKPVFWNGAKWVDAMGAIVL